MKRTMLIGLLLVGLNNVPTAKAGMKFCGLGTCYRSFKNYMYSADNYYLVPPVRPHAPKLPLRPRVEFSPTIVPGAPATALEARVPAYTRPPATMYGPAVAAPGPGVPVYGPHNTAIDPADPFGNVLPVYPPAYGSGGPSRFSVFHP